MSLGEVVKQVLIVDVNDSTAASVRANNPDEYATDADVPEHLYTSLKTLLGVSNSELARRVVAVYGEGNTLPETDAAIEIHTKVGDSSRSKRIPTDLAGAETGDMIILFRTGPVSQNKEGRLAQNLELRTRYLIDALIRGLRNASPHLPVSGDKTISKRYFLCSWERCDESELEIAAHYCLDYVRRFN